MYADATSGETTTVVDDDADDATPSPTVDAAEWRTVTDVPWFVWFFFAIAVAITSAMLVHFLLRMLGVHFVCCDGTFVLGAPPPSDADGDADDDASGAGKKARLTDEHAAGANRYGAAPMTDPAADDGTADASGDDDDGGGDDDDDDDCCSDLFTFLWSMARAAPWFVLLNVATCFVGVSVRAVLHVPTPWNAVGRPAAGLALAVVSRAVVRDAPTRHHTTQRPNV